MSVYQVIADEIRSSIEGNDSTVSYYRKKYGRDDFPVYVLKTGGKKFNPKRPEAWVSRETFDWMFSHEVVDHFKITALVEIYIKCSNTQYFNWFMTEPSRLCLNWLCKHSPTLDKLCPITSILPSAEWRCGIYQAIERLELIDKIGDTELAFVANI